MSIEQKATLVPYSLVTMPQAEILARLQALKRHLAVALASESNSSADQLLIGADLLLLLDKVKNTSCNTLLKQKALAFIRKGLVELDSYHAKEAANTSYTPVPLKVAGKNLEQAINLMLFSYT